MQASARTCGRRADRQHDRKCRLKSSQYTLIIPHRVIQLTTISFWSPRQGCASHKSTNKQIPSEVSEEASDTVIHFYFYFFSSTEELCSQPVRGNIHWIGRMFPEHVERSFLDPESSQFDEYFQLGSRRKVHPVKKTNRFAEYFQLGSRTNIRPIKNGLKQFTTRPKNGSSNPTLLFFNLMMMSWCLISSDVMRHIRDKLWPISRSTVQ